MRNSEQEPIPVLKHHVERVNDMFAGITDHASAQKAVRYDWLPNLRKWVYINGDPLYPQLINGTEEQIDAFVRNTATIIVAVNTGNYVPVPEWEDGHGRNADLICQACGNLGKSYAFKDGVMCKVPSKVNENLRKFFPRLFEFQDKRLKSDFKFEPIEHLNNKKYPEYSKTEEIGHSFHSDINVKKLKIEKFEKKISSKNKTFTSR